MLCNTLIISVVVTKLLHFITVTTINCSNYNILTDVMITMRMFQRRVSVSNLNVNTYLSLYSAVCSGLKSSFVTNVISFSFFSSATPNYVNKNNPIVI